MIFSKQLLPFAAGVLVAGLSTVSASYFPQFNQDEDGSAGIIAGGAEHIHVSTTGYVGIGTSDPLSKFVVDGTGLSNGTPVASFEKTDSDNAIEISGTGGAGKIYWDSASTELVILVN